MILLSCHSDLWQLRLYTIASAVCQKKISQNVSDPSNTAIGCYHKDDGPIRCRATHCRARQYSLPATSAYPTTDPSTHSRYNNSRHLVLTQAHYNSRHPSSFSGTKRLDTFSLQYNNSRHLLLTKGTTTVDTIFNLKVQQQQTASSHSRNNNSRHLSSHSRYRNCRHLSSHSRYRNSSHPSSHSRYRNSRHPSSQLRYRNSRLLLT